MSNHYVFSLKSFDGQVTPANLGNKEVARNFTDAMAIGRRLSAEHPDHEVQVSKNGRMVQTIKAESDDFGKEVLY